MDKWKYVYRFRFWITEPRIGFREDLTKERSKEIASYLEREGWAFSIANMKLVHKTLP